MTKAQKRALQRKVAATVICPVCASGGFDLCTSVVPGRVGAVKTTWHPEREALRKEKWAAAKAG